MTGLADTAAAALAGVLVYAGLLKLRDHAQFLAAVLSWKLFPRGTARRVALGLPLAEVAVGGAMLASTAAGRMEAPPRLVAAVLFGLFLAGQAAIRRRTRSAACGCGGTSGSRIAVASMSRARLLALVASLTIGQ